MLEKLKKELGREIIEKAGEWLQQRGFHLTIDEMIKEEIVYFEIPKEDKTSLYWIVAGGGIPGEIVDKVAHQVHEVVEIIEIKKRTQLRGSTEAFKDERYSAVRAEAHGIAEEVEKEFLREADKKEIEKEFSRFQGILQEEKKRDEEIIKELEEKIKKIRKKDSIA